MSVFFTKAVGALRRKQSETELWSLSFSDNFLQRFLSARNFDLSDTLQLLQSYIHATKRDLRLFQLPSQVKVVFDDHVVGALQRKLPTGESVLIVRFGYWEVDNYNYEAILAAVVASIELLLFDELNQMNGLVMICDMARFGLKQMRDTGPLQCKRYVDLTKILPLKFKEIHVVNNPKIFDVANMMIIPLLSDSVRSKIQFHDDGLSVLHKTVPTSILPLEYGGELEPFNCVHWYNELILHEGRLKMLWEDYTA